MSARRYAGRSPRASIRSIPVGEKTDSVLYAQYRGDHPDPDALIFNYDHLLHEYEREYGLALRVYESGRRLQSCLGLAGDQVGHWRGELVGPSLSVGNAWLREDLREGRLGRRMLLALLTHAAHRGALLARGGLHSTGAHRAHESVSREFGLDYTGALREGAEEVEEGPNDQRYDEYVYALDPAGRARK